MSHANDQPSSEPYQFDQDGALLRTDLPWPCRRGKVRDVYDLGDRLMIVSTDRISAFDYILPTGISGKGRLLTAMSEFWFQQLDVGAIAQHDGGPIHHHRISTDVPSDVADVVDAEPLRGRIMISRRAEVIPFECVVRGYLEGSGWKAYQSEGSICGVDLPAGLSQCDALPRPIFTPATKADTGHDENVSWEVMADSLGNPLATQLRDLSLAIYSLAAAIANKRGLLIADTKFEFGIIDGEVILIDEILTPDSSRYWAADEYIAGRPQRSFDKQFVREFLMASDWDRQSDPPPLPAEIIRQTQARYQEGYDRLAECR
ncbi:MAG: phosphoribosylaminoimidazolesuccinocarboxamide synthase [Planctomycetota bacterium]